MLRLRRSTLRIDTKLLLPAVSLGASPFVMQSTESLLTVAFNVSLLKYGGDLAVGAMTILTSVAQMIQLPLTGLAQGAQPILSYNFGHPLRVTAKRAEIDYRIQGKGVFRL